MLCRYRRDERGHLKQFKRIEAHIVSGNEHIPTDDTLKLCGDATLVKVGACVHARVCVRVNVCE